MNNLKHLYTYNVFLTLTQLTQKAWSSNKTMILFITAIIDIYVFYWRKGFKFRNCWERGAWNEHKGMKLWQYLQLIQHSWILFFNITLNIAIFSFGTTSQEDEMADLLSFLAVTTNLIKGIKAVCF